MNSPNLKSEISNLKSDELGALYGRVSTDRQSDSLDAQDAKGLAYAAPLSIRVPAALTFAEEDISGGTALADRPQGAHLMRALKFGWAPPGEPESLAPVKHLIVTKPDRLGRDAVNLLNIWDWCEANGITLHIVDFGGNTIVSQGFMGKLVYGILALFAEFERSMIRDRINGAFARKRERGEACGGVTYGWDLVPSGRTKLVKRKSRGPDGRLIEETSEREIMLEQPNETEQHWLRQMADWRYTQKLGWRKIAERLNALGVQTKTRSAPWQQGNVAKVLGSRHAKLLLSTHL